MSALMIARINVKDQKKFEDYLKGNRSVAGPFGAEILFRGRAARALNGPDDHKVVVVVRFPDVESISGWFDSDAYQPLAVLREEAADMRMTAYTGID